MGERPSCLLWREIFHTFTRCNKNSNKDKYKGSNKATHDNLHHIINTVQVSPKKGEIVSCQGQWPCISSTLFCETPLRKKLRWNFNYPPVCWDETFFFFLRGRGLSRRWKCLISFCTHQEIKSCLTSTVEVGADWTVCGCHKSMRPLCWSRQWSFSADPCYQAAVGLPSSNLLWSFVSNWTVGVSLHLFCMLVLSIICAITDILICLC